MKVPFTKMSGAGNDFVVVDNRQNVITRHAEFARRVCDRRWGIGADGILLVEPDKSEPYGMAYYNADGSYGGMCGNGGRCIALYAHMSGIAPASHTFRALDHVYQARIAGETVTLRMKDPSRMRKGLRISIPGHSMTGHFVDTGSPHVVVFVEDVDRGEVPLGALDVSGMGKAIRHHELFQPEGTNANFVEVTKESLCNIRTYERGVEAETLACGTGSIAAAVISSELKGLKPPVTVKPAGNVKLVVGFVKEGPSVRSVDLSGPAVVTFTGTIEI
jgi:diaminopimelate epimerase